MDNYHSNQPKTEKTPPPGFPGYRTQPGRSGLDYIDSARESSFMEGKFYRNLFTCRLRTKNPIYLTVMLIVGLGLLLPMIAALVEFFSENRASLPICFALPMAIVGIALLTNFLKNTWLTSASPKEESAEGSNGETIEPIRPQIQRKIRYKDQSR